MKKISILLTAAILLSACTDKESVNTAEEVDKLAPLGQANTETSVYEGDEQAKASQAGNSADAENSREEIFDGTAIQPSKLPEYETISRETDGKKYSYKIAADHKDKRVMFLIDKEGKEIYKTVYIKRDSRLKIIKLGEGQIFNNKIKNR